MRTHIVEARGGFEVIFSFVNETRGVRDVGALAGRVAGPVQSADLQTEVQQSYGVRVLFLWANK